MNKARSDAEIVQQTEDLAAYLISWAFNREPETKLIKIRDSKHPIAERCWEAACRIQEMLTQTDVKNAASNEDEQERVTNG